MCPFVSADVRGGGRLRDEPKECLRRRLVRNDLLIFIRLVEYKYEKTFVVLNDRLLTSQKDGLRNKLNLTNQKTIASLQAVPSPSRASLPAFILTSLPFYGLPRRL